MNLQWQYSKAMDKYVVDRKPSRDRYLNIYNHELGNHFSQWLESLKLLIIQIDSHPHAEFIWYIARYIEGNRIHSVLSSAIGVADAYDPITKFMSCMIPFHYEEAALDILYFIARKACYPYTDIYRLKMTLHNHYDTCTEGDCSRCKCLMRNILALGKCFGCSIRRNQMISLLYVAKRRNMYLPPEMWQHICLMMPSHTCIPDMHQVNKEYILDEFSRGRHRAWCVDIWGAIHLGRRQRWFGEYDQ
jgi:hypothetical protein